MKIQKASVTRTVSELRQSMRKRLNRIRDTPKKYLAGDLHLTKTPEHLLSNAELNTGFVRIDTMDERAYRNSVFLDASRPGNFHSTMGGLWTVDIRELPGLADSIEGLSSPLPHIISHPGYCGSTLMANMLEALSPFFVYREPVVWARLSDLMFEPRYANRYPEQQFRDIYRSALRLFSRTWEPQQQAIIKSIPAATGIDLHAHEFDPGIRCIYLRPRLESYLAAVLKYGTSRVKWIEAHLNIEWLWQNSGLEGLRTELDSLPSHLKTALYWKLHTGTVKRHEKSHSSGMMTIASDDFFRDKKATLIRVAAHFGCSIEDEELLQLLQSNVLTRHSKQSSRRYDDSDRLREEAEILSNRKGDIAEAESWLLSLE